MLKSFDVHKIFCINCRAKNVEVFPEYLLCRSCEAKFKIVDGIPVLLMDENIKTQLEEIDYDAVHNVNDKSIQIVTENWKKIFTEFHVPVGDVMELGAGTGALTSCLTNAFSFKSIHATDISHKFLLTARQRIGQGAAQKNFYVCDANHLPFIENSFDAVVGHSVLHHFLNYETILADVLSMLRAGGAAIFFEPVLQGKAKIALMLQLMCMIDNRTTPGFLDEEDKNKINVLRKHIVKSLVIKNDKGKLATMEDKYIFDINAMKTLGKRIGYSEVHYRNWLNPDERFQVGLEQHLLMAGISEEKISKFLFITRAYRENMVRLLPDEQYTPMGFFVFKK